VFGATSGEVLNIQSPDETLLFPNKGHVNIDCAGRNCWNA
jgi:hypothetical protein